MENPSNNMLRCIAHQIAMAYLGKPYIWGGDDPMRGFDCSGFVIEILKSVGKLPRRGDWTADMLYNRLPKIERKDVRNGCLIFWEGNSGKMIHVEFMINSTLAIGASGGGSKTKTIEDAIQQNAFIKVRPIDSRPGPKWFCDPFKENT